MIDKIKAFFSNLLSVIKSKVSFIWNSVKYIFFAIVGIVVLIEYNKIKEWLLVRAGQKEIANDNKVDKSLSTQENAAKSQADALEAQSRALPGEEAPVSENWYEKDKK